MISNLNDFDRISIFFPHIHFTKITHQISRASYDPRCPHHYVPLHIYCISDLDPC